MDQAAAAPGVRAGRVRHWRKRQRPAGHTSGRAHGRPGRCRHPPEKRDAVLCRASAPPYMASLRVKEQLVSAADAEDRNTAPPLPGGAARQGGVGRRAGKPGEGRGSTDGQSELGARRCGHPGGGHSRARPLPPAAHCTVSEHPRVRAHPLQCSPKTCWPAAPPTSLGRAPPPPRPGPHGCERSRSTRRPARRPARKPTTRQAKQRAMSVSACACTCCGIPPTQRRSRQGGSRTEERQGCGAPCPPTQRRRPTSRCPGSAGCAAPAWLRGGSQSGRRTQRRGLRDARAAMRGQRRQQGREGRQEGETGLPPEQNMAAACSRAGAPRPPDTRKNCSALPPASK